MNAFIALIVFGVWLSGVFGLIIWICTETDDYDRMPDYAVIVIWPVVLFIGVVFVLPIQAAQWIGHKLRERNST